MSDENLESLRRSLGDAASKQAKRMLRQRLREQNLRSIIETDWGISPQFNMPVQVLPDREYLRDYVGAVVRVCEGAKEGGIATTTVDGCLRVLAVRSGHGLAPDDDPGAIVHCFYHLGEGVKECVLNDPNRRQPEIDAMRRLAPVVDLVAHNMRDAISFPIFLFPDHELVMDLIVGRVRAFVQFDLTRFFEMAAAEGIMLSWADAKEIGSYRKLPAMIPGSPGAYGAAGRPGPVVALTGPFFGRATIR